MDPKTYTLCFVDMMGLPDYDCDTPYERPLGGTQSALCYYAEHLAQAGHTVTVLNHGCVSEHMSRGVIFKPFMEVEVGTSF